jgi:TctA family transporter
VAPCFPMLTLGVPGDAVTAIFIVRETVKGLNPGPLLSPTTRPGVPQLYRNVYSNT